MGSHRGAAGFRISNATAAFAIGFPVGYIAAMRRHVARVPRELLVIASRFVRITSAFLRKPMSPEPYYEAHADRLPAGSA